MPKHLVNLDALIPREDFEVTDEGKPDWQKPGAIEIRNLESSAFFFGALRKPDFQRETANWSADKIVDFVKTFLDGDLIPALILWQSGPSIFVIDGAHRLSALICWVQDDYGDGKRSLEFFQNSIPEEQRQAAERARRLLKSKIGTYAEHVTAVTAPATSRSEVAQRAKRMASLAIQAQWVTGNSEKAEASFFNINQEATPIDNTELRILKSRKSPNALSARVILRGATGHKHWGAFPDSIQPEIENQGKEIYAGLFTPSLKTPLKTLDVPVAGRGYSAQALPLIFDLVNLSNDIRVVDATRKPKKEEKGLPPDTDGQSTLKFLKNTARTVRRLSGLHPSSLGLHPAVYFYSAAGRYQPTAFLAMVSLVRELEQRDQFDKFTSTRRVFEEFWLRHKIFANQVTVKFGSGPKGFDRLKSLYQFVLEKLESGSDETEVLAGIASHSDFSFLTPRDELKSARRRTFSTEQKSEIFLRAALENPVRCAICGGLLHANSITTDHIQRKQDGGIAVIDNGQLTHPYCNTTYKERSENRNRAPGAIQRPR